MTISGVYPRACRSGRVIQSRVHVAVSLRDPRTDSGRAITNLDEVLERIRAGIPRSATLVVMRPHQQTFWAKVANIRSNAPSDARARIRWNARWNVTVLLRLAASRQS